MGEQDTEKLQTLLQNVNFIDDEFHLQEGASSEQNTEFDEEIGYIEDIIISKEFQAAQEKFMMKYFGSFRDSLDSKVLDLRKIHEQYKHVLGSLLENEMKKRLPQFCLDDLLKNLENNRSDLEGEVFEMIFSFKDFANFKETMVDYGKAKKGEVEDLSLGLKQTPLSARSDIEMMSPSSSINCSNSLDCEMISPRSLEQSKCYTSEQSNEQKNL